MSKLTCQHLKKGRSVLDSKRFEKFTLLIDGVHKSIHKIKLDMAPKVGVKGVHVLWVYELYEHKEGLTSTELASVSRIDRSLVSREIDDLMKEGCIECIDKSSGKRYNGRFVLTERGRELAEWIIERVLDVQNSVSSGISKEELETFYSVLERLDKNLEELTEVKAK